MEDNGPVPVTPGLPGLQGHPRFPFKRRGLISGILQQGQCTAVSKAEQRVDSESTGWMADRGEHE